MNGDRIKVLALGGGDEIGASSYLIHAREGTVLLDAGLRPHPGNNTPSFIHMFNTIDDWGSIKALIVSHAHLDHVGALPKVYQENPNIKIFVPQNSKKMITVQILETLTQKKNQSKYDPDYPGILFSEEVSKACVERMVEVPFFSQFKVPKTNLKVELWPAGHILGSASILLSANRWRLLYTGDVSTFPRSAIPNLNYNPEKVNVLLMESTYLGSPDSEPPGTVFERLYEKARQVTARGGTVLIPSFSLGKAQDILKRLVDANDQNPHSPIPVFVDGLVKKICRIYEQEIPGFKIMGVNRCLPVRCNASQYPRFLAEHRGSIIVASSGMMHPNTKSAMWAESIIDDDSCAIFFTGYLDEESPGKKMLDLKRNDVIDLNGERKHVNAMIDRYYMSTHAPESGLLSLVEKVNPDTIILVHGNARTNVLDNFQRQAELTCNKHIDMKKGINHQVTEVMLP